jgi:hypothetical protein
MNQSSPVLWFRFERRLVGWLAARFSGRIARCDQLLNLPKPE